MGLQTAMPLHRDVARLAEATVIEPHIPLHREVARGPRPLLYSAPQRCS